MRNFHKDLIKFFNSFQNVSNCTCYFRKIISVPRPIFLKIFFRNYSKIVPKFSLNFLIVQLMKNEKLFKKLCGHCIISIRRQLFHPVSNNRHLQRPLCLKTQIALILVVHLEYLHYQIVKLEVKMETFFGITRWKNSTSVPSVDRNHRYSHETHPSYQPYKEGQTACIFLLCLFLLHPYHVEIHHGASQF